MPRRPRICPGGTCFHVINRAVARLTLFEKGSELHSFRTCAGRSPEQSGTADLCVHRDAQSLAFCSQVAIDCPRYLFLAWTVGKGVGSRVVDAVGALQSNFIGRGIWAHVSGRRG